MLDEVPGIGSITKKKLLQNSVAINQLQRQKANRISLSRHRGQKSNCFKTYIDSYKNDGARKVILAYTK